MDVLEQVANLNVWTRGERRAPHKPLLLLLALGRWKAGQGTTMCLDDIEEDLRGLLDAFAPPVISRHQPELPFWHLRSDNLWFVEGESEMTRQKGGFPKLNELRKTHGGLAPEILASLEADDELLPKVIASLLDNHFPQSLHDEILRSVGLELPEDATASTTRRRRDPKFQSNVLRAYEHQCAVTGFRASLGRSYFGVEAAHVHWHARGGRDDVSNGLALDPLLHLLLDRGAWSLTDDRRVLVSADFTGSDEAKNRLRSYHGKPIREPLEKSSRLSVESIRWHREQDLGGVFRGHPLSLPQNG